MLELKNSLRYKNLIIDVLRDGGFYSKAELLDKINSKLIEDDYRPIGLKTIERTIVKLREDNFILEEKIIDRKKHFKLEEYPGHHYQFTEEEINTFPLLLGLLETENKLNSVSWIKDVLQENFPLFKEDFDISKYYVNVQPSINNHESLILLAGKIINSMKNETAIQFDYVKENGDKRNDVIVAPVQIRYYENRYYLIASKYNHETHEFPNIIRTYLLDKITNCRVNNVTHNGKLIKYNHHNLFKTTDVENIFNNCIGMYFMNSEYENNVLKTFKLKFSGPSKGIIKNRKIHHSQRVISENENSITIEISVWDTIEVYSYLKRFGNDCELLK